MITVEERRARQKAYYEAHKEQLQAYQREYNLRHKSTRNRKRQGSSDFPRHRLQTKGQHFHYSDIMHASPERAAAIINKVTHREAVLVGPR